MISISRKIFGKEVKNNFDQYPLKIFTEKELKDKMTTLFFLLILHQLPSFFSFFEPWVFI